MHLTEDERRLLLSIAREAISENLEGRNYTVNETSLRGNLSKPCGAFVTLRVAGDLRGCIGYADSEKPLAETVAEVAVKSSSQDPRFAPLTAGELEEVLIEISVLSPMHKIEDFININIGEHGLYLEGEFSRGLLLPQVAVDNKWDRETFIAQLGKKAGIEGFYKGYPGVTVYTFTADVFNDGSVPKNN